MRLFKKVLAMSMATALAFTSVEMPVHATGYTDIQTQAVAETQTGVESTDAATSNDATDTSSQANEIVVNEGVDTSTQETTDDTTSTNGEATAEGTTDSKAATGDTTITDSTTTEGTSSTDSAATTDSKASTDSTTSTEDTTTIDNAAKAEEVSAMQKQINDALLENGTISLTEDVQIDKMLELKLPENVEKAELTIELNGFKITSDVVEALMHVSENVTLTIKGEGSIINNTDQGIVIYNEGTVNLDNAKLLATGTKSIGVLNNSALGEKGLIIKSGTIKAEWFAIGKTAKAEASVKRPAAFFATAGIIIPSSNTSATDTTTIDTTTTDSTSTDTTATTDATTVTETSTAVSINTDSIEQGTYSIDENATVVDATENNITVTNNNTTTAEDKTASEDKVTTTDSQDTTIQPEASNGATLDSNSTTVQAQQTVINAPAMPLNVTATINSYSSVKISWSPVTDAQGYIVERIQTGTESAYTPFSAISATEYIDNQIAVGKEYKYHVYAITTNGSDILKSAVSSDVTVKTTLSAPQSLTAVQASATSVKLIWNAVDGAQKYNIYRSTKDGEYKLLSTIESTEYKDSSLKTGTKYTYKVSAVNADYESDHSDSTSLYAAAAGVTKLKASSRAYNNINLSWKKAKGATKYAIYRSTSETDGYKKIKTVTTTKYTDSKIKTGVKYYYKVVSYSNKAKGGVSAIISATAVCAKPTNVKAVDKSNGSAKVTWTKTKGAGSYAIYRSTSKNTGYTLIKTVSKSKSNYTDKSVTVGTKYYYKVCAVNKGTEGKMSKAAAVSIKPTAVKDLKVKSAGGKDVTLTWTSTNGAATYEVYYSKKENSGYKKLGSTTDLTYTVTKLKDGRRYYYRIYAVSGSVKSDYTQVTYVNPKAISLSSSSLNLESGETAKLTVSFNPEKVNDTSITWTSANSKIATVSSKGIITALSEGITIITATACNGVTATCEVGVDQETSGVVVVLDPGHGGGDAGTSYGSLKEKDLNLKISQYTKAELEKYSGVIVKMTRTTDVFVDLEDRTEIAKNYGADLFVSQHINSGTSSASGSEVYVSLNSNYNAASTKLGSQITYRLAGVGLNNRGVKTRLSSDGVSDYYSVIRNSVKRGIPGIIVEAAFLSNAEDRELLSSEAGLKTIGVATATAIAEYYGLSKK